MLTDLTYAAALRDAAEQLHTQHRTCNNSDEHKTQTGMEMCMLAPEAAVAPLHMI
jgi:hypothetical protein